ncbi:hypothetical protein [Moorena sp. SIO3I6]|uniref:hypothetical protein n=1 Tax=Moorena sp. SIO3I6 TaxID=2607831 RepID=UPI0013F6F840|nr:hypothetical protein [Moorena sp. SIO3I6]NEP24158.1 hypothetical protein [Moorena sp. SIO3I6]
MAIDQTPVEWKKPTSHVQENEAGIELQTECLGLCKIHDAENGQVIIDVIPELERIIGKQSPVPELSAGAAQNRFNRLFQKFIQVFTTAEHP